jgi:hypothetical protein
MLIMQQHKFEISQSLNPSFNLGDVELYEEHEITGFELSVLCGLMVHPEASFSTDVKGMALSIEWIQDYIM